MPLEYVDGTGSRRAGLLDQLEQAEGIVTGWVHLGSGDAYLDIGIEQPEGQRLFLQAERRRCQQAQSIACERGHLLGLQGIDGALFEECLFDKLGAKDEASTAGAPAAVVNAINDALSPFGVTVNSQPVTPEKILRALGRID